MPSFKYDFRSPYMAARIITTNGTIIPLWVGSGAGTQAESVAQSRELGSAAFDAGNLRSLPFLTELTVTTQLAHLPIITAVLNPPYPQAIEFLNSPLIEWGQSKLEVQFGYTGGAPDGVVLSQVYSVNLFKPDINIGADTQITLNGVGTGGFSASTQQRPTVYQGTRRAIIEALLQGPDNNNRRDITLNVDAVQQGQDARAKQFLLQEEIHYSQAWTSDWMAIWTLVRECNCTMMMIGNPNGSGSQLRVFALYDMLTAKPTRTLRMYHYPGGKFGGDNNTYPILSASSPQMAVYLPGSIRGIRLSGVNSATRQPSYLDINDQSEANPRTGSNQGNIGTPAADSNSPGIDANTGAGGQAHPGSPESPSAAAQARAEFAALSTAMGINLELETIGIPDILPGEVIHVEGLGVRLTGNYGVLKVEHSIGTNGYTTKLTVVSNTGMLLQNGIQAYGTVNSQNPASGQDSGGVAGAQNTQSVTVQPQPAQ